MSDVSRLVVQFVQLVQHRTFISFDDVERTLGISRGRVIELKEHFEAKLRETNPDVRLTSRTDLNPPGFEISE